MKAAEASESSWISSSASKNYSETEWIWLRDQPLHPAHTTRKMTAFRRYVLIQVPSWLLAVVILAAIHVWFEMPRWAAVVLFAGYVVKDFALFPVLRRAYEPSDPAGAERLVGAEGVVEGNGYVRVRGELWRAEGPTMERGVRVRVEKARGMTLSVKRKDGLDPAR